MSYTTPLGDTIWNGVDSDMENGTLNMWVYFDSDAVLTSDTPIEFFVHQKKYDSYVVGRIRYQMEFETGTGVRMRLVLNSGLSGPSRYSSNITVTSDLGLGLLGWHMYTVTWDRAAASGNILHYLDGLLLQAGGTSDVIPSMTNPDSDIFQLGEISGPYRAGASGVVRTAHLAVWKSALVSSDIVALYNAMTSNDAVTVTTFKGGTGISAIFENPTNQTAYATKFDVRGKRLKLYQPNTYTRRDIGSAQAIGERKFTLDMTYQDAPLSGKDAGDFLITILPSALTRINTIVFDSQRNAYMQTMALSIEPGDRMTVVDEYTGLAEDYWVNGIEGRIYGPGYQEIKLFVARVFDIPFWLLGTVGYSELNETTYVSY